MLIADVFNLFNRSSRSTTDGRMAEFDERLTEAIAWIMQQRGGHRREKRVPEIDPGTRASASVKN